MARPSGYELNRDAWDDMVRLNGTTLTKVANRTGIARPTLSSLAGKHSNASRAVADKLADALACNVGTLFPALEGEGR